MQEVCRSVCGGSGAGMRAVVRCDGMALAMGRAMQAVHGRVAEIALALASGPCNGRIVNGAG